LCILFIIFIIVYNIIFIFTKATFKFIKIIAIVPAKGLSRILGLFYNSGKGTKKEKENKQPVKLRRSPKLRDIILTLSPIILGINNP